MIDGKSFFDQPIKNDFKKYETITKIATGKGDDSTLAVSQIILIS